MAHTLEQIGPGVLAWLADRPDRSTPNAGIVIAEDGLTVIDTMTTPTQAVPLAAALAGLTPLPVRRIVLSSSHIGQVGGSPAFPLAAVYGSEQTSHHLDQPAAPDIWSRIHPEHAGDFAEVTSRPVTHMVAEPAHLCPACIAVPVGGHQFENLVVQVPAANVVFAGAMASFGVTPLGFDADFGRWIESLEQLMSWGEIIVPGYGTVGGHEEARTLQRYLRACVEADGSVDRLGDGDWSAWTDQEFHAVNVERAALLAAGDASPPPSYRRLLGLA